jgi:hypothetical protein
MDKREDYVAALKARLNAWSAEFHRLEARADVMGSEVGEKYRNSMAELHRQRLAVQRRLEQIEDAGEHAWHELRDEAERIWIAMKAGLDALRDFSDHA